MSHYLSNHDTMRERAVTRNCRSQVCHICPQQILRDHGAKSQDRLVGIRERNLEASSYLGSLGLIQDLVRIRIIFFAIYVYMYQEFCGICRNFPWCLVTMHSHTHTHQSTHTHVGLFKSCRLAQAFGAVSQCYSYKIVLKGVMTSLGGMGVLNFIIFPEVQL